MTAGKSARVKSVKITGHQLGRFTATEVIGGVLCRITLEQDPSGRYREVSCTPIGRREEASSRA